MLTRDHTVLSAERMFHNPQVEWAISAFTPQLQRFAEFLPVPIIHPADGRRLSRLGWLITWRDGTPSDGHPSQYYTGSTFVDEPYTVTITPHRHQKVGRNYIRDNYSVSTKKRPPKYNGVVFETDYLANIIEIVTTEFSIHLYTVCKNSWKFHVKIVFLRSPYGIGQTIVFLPCGFFFLFLLAISAVKDWMSTMVWP